MSSFAKLELLGRASDNFHIKTNEDGTPKLATFRVGVINIYNEVQWHKVVVKDAYVINVAQNYVKPNCMILVKGNYVVNRWNDANGNDNIGYEPVATEVYAFNQQKSEKYTNASQY